jgi:hypothetical protein
MNIQALFDMMGKSMAQERSKYHVTLGAMIEALKGMPADTPVVFDDGETGPGTANSYRGYYEDLAFNDMQGVTVGQFRSVCSESLGSTFQGYKGGNYRMTEATPLWRAPWGSCGRAIVDVVGAGGKLVLVTKDVD